MRLMRWLVVGCSLGKIRDDRNRYKMAEQGLLPRFGPVRKTPRPDEEQAQVQSGSAGVTPPNERTRNRVAGITAGNERNSMTTATADRTDSSMDVSGELNAETNENISSAVGITAGSNQAQHRFPLGRWTSVFRNPFGKSSLSPAPVRTPVQSELLLDLVKPVRNDLTDSDLVVVPGRPAASGNAQTTGAAAVPVEGPRPVITAQPEPGEPVPLVPSVPSVQLAPSAQPVWSRLKTQFFGVEKG
jgi:hypothetical protein